MIMKKDPEYNKLIKTLRKNGNKGALKLENNEWTYVPAEKCKDYDPEKLEFANQIVWERKFNGLDSITELMPGDKCYFTSNRGAEYVVYADYYSGKLEMYSTRDFPFKRVKVTKDAKKCFMVVDKYTGLDPQDQEDEFEELLKNMHKHTR